MYSLVDFFYLFPVFLRSDVSDIRYQIERLAKSVSQVTCEGHVKWVTNEKSRKDRSVSKGEKLSLERCIDLKMRYRSEIAGTGVKKSNRGLKDLRQGAGETRRE